jgi:hypothetical protein
MSRRKKKGEPEMLIVSFCDIVTITTASMFFALLITVQEAVKIPVFKPTPRAAPTNKSPVFFECRNNEVVYVDKDSLDKQVAELLSTLNPGLRGGELAPFLKALQGKEIGNTYYKVDPKFLLVGVVALEARTEGHGETEAALKSPNNNFQRVLDGLDKKAQYVVYLVRDDSFPVFRKARFLSDEADFDSGWELLGPDEAIKFGQGGTQILSQ